jgi:protein-tyrosine phosphatase
VIDLHAHVLPAIDDGPATYAEAVAAVAAARDEGVRTLAATPHVRPDHPAVRPAELAAHTAQLRQACTEAGVDVELVSGGEIDLIWAQRAADEQLAAASYGGHGRDLLVETPYADLTPSFEEMLFRLTARGFRILLAHPERSRAFQRTPRRLRELVDRGILLQITAGALVARDRRSRSSALALALVRERACHVIASDRHGTDITRSGLRDGVEAAARACGVRAMWMATDAPAAILAGEPLPPPPPADPPSRWWRPRRR